MVRNKFYFIRNKGFISFLFFLFLFPMVLSLSGNLTAEIDPGIVVNYREFKQGSTTTQFLYLTDTQLTNIEDMTLEKPYEGKIIFFDPTDLTVDAVDNYIGVSENVKVSYNYVRINSSALTSLAKPALVYLYDLIYTTPEVLRNGVLCPQEMCSIISYNSGDIVFRVENFSEYSVREKVNSGGEDGESGGSSGGGSGSGGEASISDESSLGGGDESIGLPDFNVSIDRLSINLKKGQLVQKTISLENNGTAEISIALDVETFGEFISPNERYFHLAPGEVREVEIDFYFPKRLAADIYIGKIKFFSHDIERYVDIVLNLNDDSLFDVRATVLKNEYMAFEKVKANISLFPLGRESVVTNLTYSILDFDKKIVVTMQEELIINESIFIVKELSLPAGAVPGTYLFYARLDYDEAFAFSSDSFEVSDQSLRSFIRYIGTVGISAILFVLFLFLAIVGLIIFYFRTVKNQKQGKKESMGKMRTRKKVRIPNIN